MSKGYVESKGVNILNTDAVLTTAGGDGRRAKYGRTGLGGRVEGFGAFLKRR